jgi:hypothetical protein
MCTVAVVLSMHATAAGAQHVAPRTVAPRTELTRDAIARCQAAENVPAPQLAMALTAALDRAEEAVRASPQDPVAHFAVFCSLAKRARSNSTGNGVLAALSDIRRAQRELDIALTLAPEYPGALAAKGAMLMELPCFLGGDRNEGERLLQRAVALDPDDEQVRIMLTKALQGSGR